LLSVILSFSGVQTSIARKITSIVNSKFETDINIERIDLSSLRDVELKGVMIRDHHQDTLIYTDLLKTSILNYLKLADNNFELGPVLLKDGMLKMKTYKDEETNNLTYFVNQFNTDSVEGPNTFHLETEQIRMENIGYYLYDENKYPEPVVFYNRIYGDFNDFRIDGPIVKTRIRSAKLYENHKLMIEEFDTDFMYSHTKMEFFNTKLTTAISDIEAQIVFNYKEGDLSDFNNKVQIDADFTKIDVSLADLKKFYNEFGTHDKFHLKTHFTGTINDFILKDLKMDSERKSHLNGDVHIKNVLNPDRFYLNADIKKWVSSFELLNILLPDLLGKNLPEGLSQFGSFNISGNVVIDKDNIKTDIKTISDLGIMNTVLEIDNVDQANAAKYKGDIEFTDFKLGRFVKDSLIGELSMTAHVDGKGFTLDSISTRVEGNITKHQYKGYTYSGIRINGLVNNRKFNGDLEVDDPNIKMNFKGLADISGDINIFDFDANVDHANFNRLNLYTKDEKAVLKGEIKMNFSGTDFNDLVGEANFKNASYTNQNDTYLFNDFNITASKKDSVKEITFNSPDIVNGRITGVYNYRELLKVTKNVIGSTFVNYTKEPVSPGQYIDFNFTIYNKIVEVFFPEVKLGTNTFIRGKIDSDKDKIELLVKSPKIDVYQNYLENIKLQIDNKNPIYSTILSIDKFKSKYYDLNNLNLVNVFLNDTLFVRSIFKGGKDHTEDFDLSLYHTVNDQNNSVFGIKKSKISFKNNEWIINGKNNHLNKVVFDDGFKTFAIDNIDMDSGDQHMDLAGAFHDGTTSEISLKFENVNLDAITPDIDSLKFGGKVNGNIDLRKIDRQSLPFADLTINYFNINDVYYGDFSLNANADKSLREYAFDAELINGDLKSFFAIGYINFAEQIPGIVAKVGFNNFNISAFSALGKDVLKNIRGIASGEAKITGALENPDILGEIDLQDAGIGIPYLNVDYSFGADAKVKLYNQTFDFQEISISDSEKETEGVLLGKISHKKFKEWFMDLKITTDNLLVLNTKETEDALYYGTAYIKGFTTLKGPVDNMVIEVNAITNPGTEFIIPLSDVSTVGESQLIHFVDPKEEEKTEVKNEEIVFEQLKGLTLKFNLQVTKDAMAQVVIDKQTGSLLKAYSDGNLQLNIDTNGKFEMFGELVIDKGEYLFKNIVSKDFIVKKGSTIIWNGNPFDAELNITAVNHTKANPAVILDELKGTRKIDIDLITNITGTLSEAKFDFDIEIPNSSSMVSSELDFKLNNEDDKLTQFFSLLATGSFINLDQNNLNLNGNAAIAGTIAEKSSRILSEMLKSSRDDIQVGVTYDAGVKDKVENINTDDQLGIMVSGRIGNKITVNGKVGVPVGANTTSSVVGEVEVIMPLNEPETLLGKVYNRQNEIQFDPLEGEGYTQGVGISYLFQFDNSNEFLEKIGIKKTEAEKNMTKEQRDSVKAARKELRKINKKEKKK
jgi:hypothetical protein